MRRTRSIAGRKSVRPFSSMKAAYCSLGESLLGVTGDRADDNEFE